MIRVKNIYSVVKICYNQFNFKLQLVPYYQAKRNISQSKYYRPQVPVESFLNQQYIQYNTTSNGFALKYCPFCKKHHHNDPTNLYRLNVHRQTGMYHCFRCSSSGSYLDLKQALLGIKVDPIFDQMKPKIQEIQTQTISQTQYFIYKTNMQKPQYRAVKQYLLSRKLTQQTILAYNVGCSYQFFNNQRGQSINIQVMHFPMYRLLTNQQRNRKLLNLIEGNIASQGLSAQLVKVKIRGVGKQNKKYMRQYPSGPAKGLFGFNLVKNTDKIIVLTQGQLDAMSVYQATGIPSLSLPNGASSLPDEIISKLDRFEKIILWMDNDEAGKINIQKFAKKLGVSRTLIVLHSEKQLKDANDFLQKKPQLIVQIIENAKTLPDHNITTFKSLINLIRDRIFNQKQFQGVPISFFNFFNKKVKGIRPGQVTVVSGGTGSGKTTLLSQLSIDLSKHKIPVLWGSFQIRNQILITNMLTQFSSINLKKQKHAFDQVAKSFGQLPLYYMSFHGSHDVFKVLGTITYAIQRYGVTFIVIDTLQFFLSGQAQGSKKFDMQDLVMSQFRKIATTYKVHIVVVIHPRKTDDNQDIGIHSIYGTSKATQQADNIWIIQNRNGFKIFDIKKNRYDGDVGRVAIGFNKNNKSFFELKKKELQSIFNQQKTVQDIINERNELKQEKKQQSWFNFEEDTSDGDEPELQRKNTRKF